MEETRQDVEASGLNVLKLFPVVSDDPANKLECLPLARLFPDGRSILKELSNISFFQLVAFLALLTNGWV